MYETFDSIIQKHNKIQNYKNKTRTDKSPGDTDRSILSITDSDRTED